MSYEPTNWKTGDVITADKLNKLETAVTQGGGGEVFKVNMNVSGNTATLDASYNDIVAAVETGKTVLLATEDIEPGIHMILYLIGYSVNLDSFIVFFLNVGASMQFQANTADEPLTLASEQHGS